MMKNKSHMTMLNNDGLSIKPWGTPEKFDQLDNHKQTSRPYFQNHVRSIFQLISFVKDSQNLLKGRLVKP